MKSCMVFFAFVAVQGSLAKLASTADINPPLMPVSDKKFFDGPRADYATDLRPQTKHHFTWPFPEVQDSNDYDKDYVKDENGDGGEYIAQSTYDNLRAKLAKQKADLEDLKRRESSANADVDNAKKKEEAARKIAEDAHKKADEAGKKGVDGPSGDVGGLTGEVEAEIKDLEDCKEQLKKAKERLQKAIEERKAAMQAHDEAQAAEQKALAAEAKAKAEEDKLEAELKEEDHEHHEAKELKQVKEADLKKMETDLEEAAKNLRRYRNPDGSATTKGQNGGVYRSGAAESAAPMVAALAVVAAHLL